MLFTFEQSIGSGECAPIQASIRNGGEQERRGVPDNTPTSLSRAYAHSCGASNRAGGGETR
jgi:hypothetical protein